MTLGEMLTILRRDILHDRSSQVDGDSDKLWSDTTLIAYINEAQNIFARRTACLRDGSSDITRFLTVMGQETYPLDPSVIAVISMRLEGNTQYVNGIEVPGTLIDNVFTPDASLYPVFPQRRDMLRVGHGALTNYMPPDTCFVATDTAYRWPNGMPLAFDTDEYVTNDTNGSSGVMSVKILPRPDARFDGCTIQMRVVRKPVVKLTPLNLDAVPEVPEDYHLYLLDHAAYLALRIVDHDLGDPARAQEFEQSFLRRIDEAEIDMRRKMFRPAGWAFGRNGFAYVRN